MQCHLLYIHISGGQNYLLDLTSINGHGLSRWPVSVVKVCTSMLCATIGYWKMDGPVSLVHVFAQFEHS